MEVIKLAPPTWRGVTLQLLAAYRNTENPDTLKMIEEEFLNMAKAADLFNSNQGEGENNNSTIDENSGVGGRVVCE